MGTRIHPMPGEPFCDACHLGNDEPCGDEHRQWAPNWSEIAAERDQIRADLAESRAEAAKYKVEVARLNLAIVNRTTPTETMRLLAGELKSVRDALKRYGEHRWKCAISRAIRENKMCPACDCGWNEARKAQ
jgi:hypothetical protein